MSDHSVIVQSINGKITHCLEGLIYVITPEDELPPAKPTELICKHMFSGSLPQVISIILCSKYIISVIMITNTF